MLKPLRLSLVLLCSLSYWSVLQSIELQQRSSEGVPSSLQHFGVCYLIYRHNEKLLDARAHVHAHMLILSHAKQARAVWVSVMSLNDETTCCQPPVRNVVERSQHRKEPERGRGSSPSPLSPYAHHSLTLPPPSFLYRHSVFLCCLARGLSSLRSCPSGFFCIFLGTPLYRIWILFGRNIAPRRIWSDFFYSYVCIPMLIEDCFYDFIYLFILQ